VWADEARVDLKPEPPGFGQVGINLWWTDGPSIPADIVNAQQVKLEATNRDASKPVAFCFNQHNPFASPPIGETVHVVYTAESALNYSTAAGDDCVNATIDARFVTPVPAIPRAGVFGLAGSLAVAGCFFGARSLRRRGAP